MPQVVDAELLRQLRLLLDRLPDAAMEVAPPQRTAPTPVAPPESVALRATGPVRLLWPQKQEEWEESDMEFVDVATAKNSPGLRGAFVGGAPSPWGEAAKGFFHIKKIPYVRTRYLSGGDNTALVECQKL